MPPELDDICAGSAIDKDGAIVYRWRHIDGKNVGLSQEEFDALQSRFGCTFSNDWSRVAWGTKWDACQVRLLPNGEVGAWFNTAWSPPVQWLQRVSMLYPELEFALAFAECGMGYYGTATARAGAVVEDVQEVSFYARSANDDEDPPLIPAVAEHLAKYGLHEGG